MSAEKTEKPDKAEKKAKAATGEKKEKAPKPPKGEKVPKAEAEAAAKPAEPKKPREKRVVRLERLYQQEVVPLLMKEFKYKNPMEVPKVVKVSINMGLGEAIQNIKVLESAQEELKAVAGQKPVVTRARKSIAAFKLREGMPIGCTVTLRGPQMYYFLDKLFNLALPRVRDFKGVSPPRRRRRGQVECEARA